MSLELNKLISEAIEIQKKIDMLKNDMKKYSEKFKKLTEVIIPDVMESLDMESFQQSNGTTIKIKNDIKVSLAKKNLQKRANQIAWLSANGLEEIIKDTITYQFDFSDQDNKIKLLTLLTENNFSDFDCNETVHPQTLKASLKSLILEGIQVPIEEFGIHLKKVIIKK